MFYRFEAKNAEGLYVGIFSLLNPSQRRYFNRLLREPKWYEKHPAVPSRCWFTEEGYSRFHPIMAELIDEAGLKDVRLLTEPNLANIVCKGKLQCIEAL